MRFAVRAGVIVVSMVTGLLAAEMTVRSIDGWPVVGRLPLAEHAVDEATTRETDRPDRRHVRDIPLAAGVSAGWYEQTPPPPPVVRMTPEIAARAERYKSNPYEAFTEWNRNYVHTMVCAGVTDYGLGAMDDVYVFSPPEPGEYPIYRNPPSVSLPGWFTTNRFGWRGPDLDINKDGRTIRIAFVGASTTVGAYYLPFSYPEFIGGWLSTWLQTRHPDVHVEVINAARTGIDSFSIAAIVRQEVLPLEPDLVVYYEGANSFSPLQTLNVPEKLRRSRPKFTFRPPTTLERYSALARRAASLVMRFSATDGREPAKGSFPMVWPAGVDEQHPDPDGPALPMSLNATVRNLDAIRTAVDATGGELAVASFAWMIPDPHTPLDLTRHLGLYQYLNQTLWPIKYDQLRRATAFQNRAFRAYADKRRVAYVPVAEQLPQDPDLFSDPIHMGGPGLRLQGWIMLQRLVPWIEERLGDHRLPRAMRTPRVTHPAFVDGATELVAIRTIKETCH